MDECKGIFGKLFGHDFKEFLTETSLSKTFPWDKIRQAENISGLVESATEKKYSVMCSRCGAKGETMAKLSAEEHAKRAKELFKKEGKVPFIVVFHDKKYIQHLFDLAKELDCEMSEVSHILINKALMHTSDKDKDVVRNVIKLEQKVKS